MNEGANYWFEKRIKIKTKEKRIMISAKEAFEATKGQAQKVKEEKLSTVEAAINQATAQELYSTKFTFAQLKPYVGIVVETLTSLGYKIEQNSTGLVVSWDLKATGNEAKPSAVMVAADDSEDKEFEVVREEDEDDYWNRVDDSDIPF